MSVSSGLSGRYAKAIYELAVEKEILTKFSYVSNNAYLHFDKNLMPQRKSAWSSWNSITKENIKVEIILRVSF